jgi:hypothetical protein
VFLLAQVLSEEVCAFVVSQADPVQTIRRLPAEMAAVFNASTASAARARFNELVAKGRICPSKEVAHLAADEDRDCGATKKTPEVLRRLVDRHIGLEWVPADLDLTKTDVVEDVEVEVTLFTAVCVELWSERRLAVLAQVRSMPVHFMLVLSLFAHQPLVSFAQVWGRMGYDAVKDRLQTAVGQHPPARTRSILKSFTRSVFDAVVQIGYTDHLQRTARVFYPGPFLDDSRTLILFRFHISAFGLDGFWSSWSDKCRLLGELVLAWIAFQVCAPNLSSTFTSTLTAAIATFTSTSTSTCTSTLTAAIATLTVTFIPPSPPRPPSPPPSPPPPPPPPPFPLLSLSLPLGRQSSVPHPQLRPEVLQVFLANQRELIATFPTSAKQICAYLREAWADAPVNGGRDALMAEVSRRKGSKGCHCSPEDCTFGRRAAERATQSVAPQRAQPPAHHRAEFIKDGRLLVS